MTQTGADEAVKLNTEVHVLAPRVWLDLTTFSFSVSILGTTVEELYKNSVQQWDQLNLQVSS